LGSMAVGSVLAVGLLLSPGEGRPVFAEGVGGASWTPSRSDTTITGSRLLTPRDSITYRTEASWDRDQTNGLEAYLDDGLRYTHEVNDRSGRLSATGFWATNHPDPAYDRDDDDGDRRWEEAEITAGAARPTPGQTYTSLVQFSRWHGKRHKGECVWAWDRRLGRSEILSQLSRDLLGEWQAERYTLDYDDVTYPRVASRPSLPPASPNPRCRDPRPEDGQSGFVITFARPVAWEDFLELPPAGRVKWLAFEAIGSSAGDDLTWTCGGPVSIQIGLSQCRAMGVRPDGVSAAVGYLDEDAERGLRGSALVAAVDRLRDSLTGLLLDVGGFGVEPPGLTVNDRYWELVLAG